MKTTIPFSGFYESIWSSSLDDAETQLAEYLTGAPDADAGEGVDGFKGRSVSDVREALYWVTSYGVAHAAIAKDYAKAFASELDSEAGWSLRLKFETLDSPREYNFTTDRIFATLPRASVRRMQKECDVAILVRICRERFTSYDGFSSFYSNNPSCWGPLDAWDHNQVATLLDAWMESREIDQLDLYENIDFSGALESAFTMSELSARLENENV